MKKIIPIFFLFSIVLFIITFICLKRNSTLGSEIAIMVYDEEKGDYVKVNEIPKGLYGIDRERTTCSSGGKVERYDIANYTITYDLGTADACEVYLKSSDKLSFYIKEIVYNSKENSDSIKSGEQGLYYHNRYLAHGADDNSYRYAGANPNNYVCFEGDDCSDENNLYRIISVDSTDRVKLIKLTSIGNFPWHSDSLDSSYNPIIEKSYTATGTEYDIAMGLVTGRSYANIWAIKKEDGNYYISSLNEYLNSTYLETLGLKSSLIDKTSWSVAKVELSDRDDKNIYDFMKVEIDYTKGVYDAKIGLLYGYEYGYGALPKYWTLSLNNTDPTKGYQSSKGNDWLIPSATNWLITRLNYRYGSALRILSYAGNASSNYVTTENAVYPSFTLLSSVILTNGDTTNVGTKSNPMIIK